MRRKRIIKGEGERKGIKKENQNKKGGEKEEGERKNIIIPKHKRGVRKRRTMRRSSMKM